MNYRLVRFELGPDTAAVADAIFADLIPAIKAQAGCRSVVAFGDGAAGKYGFAVIWESEQASENAKKIIGPKLSHYLAENNASGNPFSSELLAILAEG